VVAGGKEIRGMTGRVVAGGKEIRGIRFQKKKKKTFCNWVSFGAQTESI
jgi:hypothetical protein